MRKQKNFFELTGGAGGNLADEGQHGLAGRQTPFLRPFPDLSVNALTLLGLWLL